MKLYGAILKQTNGKDVFLEEEPIAARSLTEAKKVAAHFHSSPSSVIIGVVQIKQPKELTCYCPEFENDMCCWYNDNDSELYDIGDVPVWAVFFWKEYKKLAEKYRREYNSIEDENEEEIEKCICDHIEGESKLQMKFNVLFMTGC